MKMFVVGGAVRDRLLGLEPKDVDYVVVGSTPEDMLAAGFKQVGADFPVFLDVHGNEFALARTERKTGRGYRGFDTDASPTVTLEQDLERRDLTINAMAMEGDTLVDPFNGRHDLDSKVLRHVSEAFADDPVRVLRLARFHARYGDTWKVAPETMAFARKLVEDGELDFLTKERVLMEMEKALSENHPHMFFHTLRECGALGVVFPELAEADPTLLKMALFHFRSKSACFNWAKVSSMLDDPEAFEQRLNVTTHWRSFSKMFRTAVSLLTVHPVDRLYEMDAYRKKDLWGELLSFSKEAGFNLTFLEEAYNATKHVSFATLPESIRDKLSGKEISEAIFQQRLFAYASSQRVKE